MDEHTDGPHRGKSTPPDDPDEGADAFAALSDPTRVAILRALWDVEGHEATFSELRDEVGMADSGQFNYHLGKLTDQFVAKTEEGTYELRHAGLDVIGSLLAGTYTDEATIDETAVGEACPQCGEPMWFEYDGDRFTIDCKGCDSTQAQLPAPPGVFEPHDRSEAPDVARRYAWSFLRRIHTGTCPFCEGSLASCVQPLGDKFPGEVDSEVPEELGVDDPTDVPQVKHECDRCNEEVESVLSAVLLSHPAVVSFYYDQGVDVRDEPLLHLISAVDSSRIKNTDPLRASVRFTSDNEAVELTVDRDIELIETTRTDA